MKEEIKKQISDAKQRLAEIDAQRDQINAQRKNIINEIHELNVKELQLMGFVIGASVKVKWELGIITGYEQKYGESKPIVSKIKKDGTASKNTICTYSINDIKLSDNHPK